MVLKFKDQIYILQSLRIERVIFQKKKKNCSNRQKEKEKKLKGRLRF